MFCGLRKGEILGLKFSDFDFEKQTVRISRQLVANPKVKEGFEIEEYTVVERDPKTENSFRILKVPKAIMKEVERRLHYVEMKKEWYAGNYEDHGYVSSREDGKPRGHESGADKTLREKRTSRYHCPRAAPYVCDHFDREGRSAGKDLRTVRS